MTTSLQSASFPWLTVIAVVPLVGAVLLVMLPKGRDLLAKRVALGASLVAFALTVGAALAFQVDRAGEFQLTEVHSWIPAFGINYAVGVDGIALVLLVLTTTLVPIVIIAGWNDAEASGGSVKGFFALILAVETTTVGVFIATDVFLFYVLFEFMLVPIYFMIGRYGGPHRSYAAVKFLLYGLLGGLLMLAAVIGLYVVSGGPGKGTFDFLTLTNLSIDPTMQKWLFLGFFAAFAIKAPLVPFHTWLPDAAAEGTPGTTVLIVGILDKVGTFGMLRYCLELFPDASKWATPVVVALAVFSVIYGALLAIGQRNIMRLIAYTSISHFGFIVLGVFAMTTQAQGGATLYMVNHGFTTAALFIIAGFLISRRGSAAIVDFGGVHRVAPLLAGTFLVAGLSSLALPGLSSFVSEFLVLVGTFERYKVAAVVATVAIVLAAIYILYLYQRLMTGATPQLVTDRVKDLRGREMLAVAPLLAIIIGLGFAPQPLLDVINPAVNRVMTAVGASDPPPAVPPVSAEGSGS
jgi:NADH-quinone oxidoreductase subunit M